MGSVASLPVTFLVFWFIEAPVALVRFFANLNHAFFDLFSLPILLRTFFKPVKNEYRKGLVGFSIVMGIAVKSILIFANLFLLIPLLLFEIAAVLLFLLFPIITILLLFL